MWFASLLRCLKSASQRNQRDRGRWPERQQGLRFVPQLEGLECRTLPSTFTVLNLADSGPDSLRQAVLDANTNPGADVIVFAPAARGTIGLTSGQLSITDDLTIDGPGADQLAVSGSYQSRIFGVSGGATVAVSGLTITNGRAVGAPGLGGGILNTGSTLALAQVVLSNNQAVGAPGAIAGAGAIANVSGAILTVTDCLFTQNQALGGASHGGFNGSGGILNMASRLTVRHSTFLANQTIGGTGGGSAQGGGIENLNGSTATVTESTFLGNQAIAADGGGGQGFARSGAIYNNASTLTVENSTFLGNLARGGSNIINGVPVALGSAGGAGIFNANAATLFLTGSTFTGNQAVGGSNNTGTGRPSDIGTAFGGGLQNNGRATVSDCLFEDNEARGGSDNRGDGTSFQFVGTAFGGGIGTFARDVSGLHAVLTLSNVTIRHNRAVGGDGNTAGTFVNAGIGGGLGNNGSNVLVVSGGSEVTLRDSTVAHNQAVGGRGGAALGGGVANLLGGVVTVSGSTLTHNRAQGGDGGTAGDGGQGFGGGLYNGVASTHPSNLGAETVLTVEGSTITHNKAQGGAAEAGGSAGSGTGGGLWNGGTTSIFGTAISHNHALGGDGAEGSDGGNGFGGGVYNDAASSLRLERSIVTKNHANGGVGGAGGSDGEGIGGGVYNLGDFDFDALTLIFDNHASTSHDDVFNPFA